MHFHSLFLHYQSNRVPAFKDMRRKNSLPAESSAQHEDPSKCLCGTMGSGAKKSFWEAFCVSRTWTSINTTVSLETGLTLYHPVRTLVFVLLFVPGCKNLGLLASPPQPPVQPWPLSLPASAPISPTANLLQAPRDSLDKSSDSKALSSVRTLGSHHLQNSASISYET